MAVHSGASIRFALSSEPQPRPSWPARTVGRALIAGARAGDDTSVFCGGASLSWEVPVGCGDETGLKPKVALTRLHGVSVPGAAGDSATAGEQSGEQTEGRPGARRRSNSSKHRLHRVADTSVLWLGAGRSQVQILSPRLTNCLQSERLAVAGCYSMKNWVTNRCSLVRCRGRAFVPIRALTAVAISASQFVLCSLT